MQKDYLSVKNKYNCYGCRACVEVCPKNCISMVEDSETFLYPETDISKCIKCNLCNSVCPYNKSLTELSRNNNIEQSAYAAIHKKENVVNNSSSGGAFSAIINTVYDENTVIFGVKYDFNLKVKHDYTNSDDISEFQKSKYIASDTNSCFKKVKDFLKSGKKVVFSGTPCQIAALNSYLKNTDITNLLTVDVICHGVPSQKLFDKYISQYSNNRTIKNYTFKYKTCDENGNFNARTAGITFDDNTILKVNSQNDPFLKAYYSRLIYRPSCKKCKFSTIKRVSDITIGDAWGIERLYNDINPHKGCSLIISNTQKGKNIIEKLNFQMQMYDIDIEWAIKNNEQLRKSTDFHLNRNKFFRYIKHNLNFEQSVNKALKLSLIQRAFLKLKIVINKYMVK